MATLYEKYGGEAAVTAVVEEFYKRNLSDDRVKHIWATTDMDKLKAHQNAFVSKALGGPDNYAGRDMREAHAHLALTDEHFDAVVENLSAAMSVCGVSDEDISTVCGLLEPLRDACLNR